MSMWREDEIIMGALVGSRVFQNKFPAKLSFSLPFQLGQFSNVQHLHAYHHNQKPGVANPFSHRINPNSRTGWRDTGMEFG